MENTNDVVCNNSNQNLNPMYPNFFKQHKNTKEYEKLFFELSGMQLKDFLFDKYVTKLLTPYEVAAFFGCSYSTIYNKLKYYGLNRSNLEDAINKRKKIKKTGEYTKTPVDIEIETGRKFIDIITELTNDGLSPSEIARKLKLTNQTHVRQAFNKSKYKSEQILFHNIFKQKRPIKISEKIFFEKTGENLRDFLFKKHVTDELSTYKIAPMFGCDNSTTYDKLVYYGFARDLKTSRDILIKNGDINYAEINWKGRQTANKSRSNSNSQDMTFEIFKSKLELCLINKDITDVEILTSCGQWCILIGREVDITITIFDLTNNNYYKIAVEYNSDYWHRNREKNDADKKFFLVKNGWTYAVIPDNLSNKKIEITFEKVVNEIMQDINTDRNKL